MSLQPTRRSLAFGAAAAAALFGTRAAAADERFAALEAKVGGRLGVAALDVESGARIAYREAEPFPMCSTFKAMAAAAVLARVDRDRDSLDRFVPYGPAELLPHAPVTKDHVGERGMRLGELCAAAVEESDNTAANLILKAIDGPAGWTGFVRSLGDPVSRLDRTEPELNSAEPGDLRDTTSPLAMLGDLRSVTLGGALSPASRAKLVGWMEACKTGDTRLRAGLPSTWIVGDKTGTGAHGTANDIAIAWTLGRPMLITAYLTGAERASDAQRDAALAEVGDIVARTFRPVNAGVSVG